MMVNIHLKLKILIIFWVEYEDPVVSIQIQGNEEADMSGILNGTLEEPNQDDDIILTTDLRLVIEELKNEEKSVEG